LAWPTRRCSAAFYSGGRPPAPPDPATPQKPSTTAAQHCARWPLADSLAWQQAVAGGRMRHRHSAPYGQRGWASARWIHGRGAKRQHLQYRGAANTIASPQAP